MFIFIIININLLNAHFYVRTMNIITALLFIFEGFAFKGFAMVCGKPQ